MGGRYIIVARSRRSSCALCQKKAIFQFYPRRRWFLNPPSLPPWQATNAQVVCRGSQKKAGKGAGDIQTEEARSAYNVSVGPFVIPDLRPDKISIYKCPTRPQYRRPKARQAILSWGGGGQEREGEGVRYQGRWYYSQARDYLACKCMKAINYSIQLRGIRIDRFHVSTPKFKSGVRSQLSNLSFGISNLLESVSFLFSRAWCNNKFGEREDERQRASFYSPIDSRKDIAGRGLSLGSASRSQYDNQETVSGEINLPAVRVSGIVSQSSVA